MAFLKNFKKHKQTFSLNLKIPINLLPKSKKIYFMSVELVEVNVTSLGNLEYGQFIKEQTTQTGLLPANTIKDTTLISALNNVKADSSEYDKGLVKVTKNKDTNEVKKDDHTRDISYYALGAAIHLGTLSNVEEERVAAENLNNLYKTYGGSKVVNQNYGKESNSIDNLIEELESSKYSGDVALLGIGKYVTRLKTDNIAFKATFSARLKGETGQEYIDNKANREKLQNSYELLTGYVFYNAKLKGGEFIEVLNILNASRKYYANLLAIREGKKDAKKNKGEEGNDPTQNPGS